MSLMARVSIANELTGGGKPGAGPWFPCFDVVQGQYIGEAMSLPLIRPGDGIHSALAWPESGEVLDVTDSFTSIGNGTIVSEEDLLGYMLHILWLARGATRERIAELGV
jgi:hypothetical protein